jgi:hypothetical protein
MLSLTRFTVLCCILPLAGLEGCGGSSSNRSSQPPPSQGNPYSTQFAVTENPISEGGHWINGGVTGLLWHDCRTSSKLAFGTQPATTNFDDSTCLLTGTWGADQQAQATVGIATSDATQFEEVELRLRSTITPNSSTGYEINCSVKSGNPYMQIVRWNGGLGNFTLLDSRAIGCSNGDILKATVRGNTITEFKNGSAIFSVNDSTYSSGSPGMGFYIQNGASSTNADFGFSSFSSTDQF